MRAPEQKILRKENSVHLPLINTKQNVRPKKTSNKVIQSLQVIKLEEEIKPFEFETQYEYVSVLSNKIRELSHLFKISTGLALNMLMKTQYNIEEFYIVAFNHQIKKNLVNLKKMYSLREGIFNQICSICIEETQQKDLISLCCDHKFCLNCFRNYLLSLMNDEGIFCFLKTCPMAGCKVKYKMKINLLKKKF